MPLLFRDMLMEIAPIDEDAVDSYGAREAVEKLQSRCKWDQGAFGEPTCLRVSDALRAICSVLTMEPDLALE